jgi:hypothetical protein
MRYMVIEVDYDIRDIMCFGNWFHFVFGSTGLEKTYSASRESYS